MGKWNRMDRIDRNRKGWDRKECECCTGVQDSIGWNEEGWNRTDRKGWDGIGKYVSVARAFYRIG